MPCDATTCIQLQDTVCKAASLSHPDITNRALSLYSHVLYVLETGPLKSLCGGNVFVLNEGVQLLEAPFSECPASAQIDQTARVTQTPEPAIHNNVDISIVRTMFVEAYLSDRNGRSVEGNENSTIIVVE